MTTETTHKYLKLFYWQTQTVPAIYTLEATVNMHHKYKRFTFMYTIDPCIPQHPYT